MSAARTATRAVPKAGRVTARGTSADSGRRSRDGRGNGVVGKGSNANSGTLLRSEVKGKGGRAKSNVPTEPELTAGLTQAQARERVAAAEEARLWDELKSAEVARETQRQREARCREAAVDVCRRAERSNEALHAEIKELTERIVSCGEEDREHERLVNHWQAEMDAMVLEQAENMQQRDELVERLKHIEKQTREAETKAVAAELRTKQAEDRRKKERARAVASRREADELARLKDEARAGHRIAADALRHRQKQLDPSAVNWRRAALAMGIFAAFTVTRRAFDSGVQPVS
eukprot:TRINITY_DN48908_c0_g1_i1.p1 TRINITY_DN48908_c0_g1~~TRINITY_DN48908_c0_g1_i1.p1  ORF type:complete len:301 (-),score=69.67 TRINITY_DN48908_c0_g1_i1:208-1080(-)